MTRLITPLILIFVSLFSFQVSAETIYVNDRLSVPLRSGASNQHRIVKFIFSGLSLKVLARSEDGKYIQVQTAKGKSGWIEKKHVMNQVSARDRIVTLKKQYSNVDGAITDLEGKITKLKQEKNLFERQNKKLQSEKKSLEAAYDDLKVTASNPIAVLRKSKQLQRDLDQALASESQLEKENQLLKNNVMQEWFLIGGGVSLGSLIFGLLITRINWTRKRDSWGDSF